MKSPKPRGEDGTKGARTAAVSLGARAFPPGEDGVASGPDGPQRTADLYESATTGALPADVENDETDVAEVDFLGMITSAESQATLYQQQVNRKQWQQVYRAFHNEHFTGSKYSSTDWKNRSKLFVPKTRSAAKRDAAAVAASLFGTVDAINCMPGDEGDPQQRAAAAVMMEIVNYRTDRTSGKAALPWFHIAMGARQDSYLTGICVSKQYWKLEIRKSHDEEYEEEHPQTGIKEKVTRAVYKPHIDRPDSMLFPPESYIIDPAADWTNPAQSSAYLILKYPMRVDEIEAKQKDPRNPWKALATKDMYAAAESAKFDMEAIRRSREQGIDRYDESQTGETFRICWVYETFIRVGDDDYTFFSIGDKHLLTDPAPVSEIYPEQGGERPVVIGYGSLESHRIFPMSNAAAIQPLQLETNDLRNLTLDAIKQNVLPVSKVLRGRNVDMDQLKRRSAGSPILVTGKDDITWDRPPDVPQSVVFMQQRLDSELDDLAGQYNSSTVQNSNALAKTLGGLKLASGAANAVQEYDIRIWIETWCEPVLAQIVKLEQYYESDPVVLGLCGQRAQLMQKHGIDSITNELLEQEVTIRVSVGLGAGDPQQRLEKFASALQVAMPLLSQSPQFQDGSYSINVDEVMAEVFGASGYRDGGQRFITKGQPRANPMQDLNTAKLKSEIEKNKMTGKGSLMTALAAVAKVALGKKALEAEVVNALLENEHAHNAAHLNAVDHGHRHGLALRQALMGSMANGKPGEGGGGTPEDMGGAADMMMGGGGDEEAPQQQQPQQPEQPDKAALMQQVLQALREERSRPLRINFVRDPRTNRIIGGEIAPGPQGHQQPAPMAQAN